MSDQTTDPPAGADDLPPTGEPTPDADSGVAIAGVSTASAAPGGVANASVASAGVSTAGIPNVDAAATAGAPTAELRSKVAPAEQQPSRTTGKVVYLVPAGAMAAQDDPAVGSGQSAVDGGIADDRVPGAGDVIDADFDSGDLDDGDPDDGNLERTDWAWVEEWRAAQEPTPWSSGLVLTAFSALVVGVAVWVLCAGLADRPVIATLVNLLVAAGLAPAMWLSRGLPVLRWIAAGALIGVVVGWVAALLMLPLPVP